MDSKRFLFLSLDAVLVGDLAWQVAREGHDVRYYIEAETDREVADGFVPKTDDRDGIHIEDAKSVDGQGVPQANPGCR